MIRSRIILWQSKDLQCAGAALDFLFRSIAAGRATSPSRWQL